jgi:2-oxoglutarate ferredoxin oxidoreductase subunit gamma
MAEKLGNSRVANMVILGAYLARTNMVSRESLAQALSERITDGSIRECNLKAVDAGWNFAAARDGKEAL